jgi:hypothetical protein
MIKVRIEHLRTVLSNRLQLSSTPRNSFNQDGAVAIVIVLLFTSLVVIGMLALVIDSGGQYQERRVLQNVADATALAIGQDCAEGNKLGYCVSSPVVSHPANVFVTRNSDDNKSTLVRVCGRGNNLAECPTNAEKLLSCRAIDSGNYLRVEVKTLTVENRGITKNFFGQLLNAGQDGIEIRACAQVRFGAAVAAPVVFPLILSICGYDNVETPMMYYAYDENNQQYVNSPNYVENNLVYDGAVLKTLFEKDPNNAGLCKYKPIDSSIWIPNPPTITNGFVTIAGRKVVDGMGLFNCVSDKLTDCDDVGEQVLCPTLYDPVIIKVGDLVNVIAPGNTVNISDNCDQKIIEMGISGNNKKERYVNYLAKYIIDKPVYIPVFTGNYLDSAGQPVSRKLLVSNFYTVVIKAVSLGSSAQAGKIGASLASDPSTWPSGAGCTSNSYCLYGYFTRSTPPIVPPKNRDGSQPDTGVSYVYLTR